MRDLLVITPSRGRPERLRAMIDACLSLAEADTDIAIANDDDDLYDLTGYGYAWSGRVIWHHGPRAGLGAWTNHLAAAHSGEYRALASLGDDHVPRTRGWDRLLLEAIDGMGGEGIAYGDDLHQRGDLPTAPVISAGIVEAVGWMMEPSLSHMFVDNVWRDLGRAAGCLAYIPGVVIEHCHPDAGKADRDGTYAASVAGEEADRQAYERWRRERMGIDVAKVRAVMATSPVRGLPG
jgi:hypothetical protein